ncbi:MAG: hypothetical protein GW748_07070 [Alphaproteobacteria bacterium]|nr:hypothetical protein [Alphaproteobacteria bacterium]
MHRFMKKIRYGLLVVGFTLSSTLSLFASAELTQGQIEEMDFQMHGVALFSGTDPFSVGIKIATESPYSHVGILLHEASADVSDLTSWYCFESTGSAGEVLSGTLPHTRVTPWAHVSTQYPGGVTSRLLRSKEEPDVTTVTQFIRENNGKAYENNIGELLNALTDGNEKPNTETVFCSELTAELMQQLGIIDSRISSNNYLPSEFSVEKENLPFLSGYYLGDEEVVKAYQLKRITRAGIWFRHNVVERLFACVRRQGHPA